MINNYIKIALRNLRRHPAYTFINVFGLVVGMTCCMLILLFVRDELSYDRHHEKADRIYRIVSDWGDFSLPATNPPVINRLAEDFPELTIALLDKFDAQVRSELSNFSEDRLYFANPGIFDVFDIPVVRGVQETMLGEPGTIVLTEEMASKYFGNEDPIGQVLLVDNQFEVTVSGIVESMPAQSHVHFDFLVPWVTLDILMDFSNSTNWGNNGYYTYLLLPEGDTPESIEAQFPAFIERHAGESWNGSVLSLQALTDIHLHSRHNSELEPNGNIAYVYLFSVIALFILIVACVNFMNLATARSVERAKEVGIRKAVGARRIQLVLQFLSESILLAGFALAVSLVLVRAALPAFQVLSGKSISINMLDTPGTFLAFAGIALLVGVISGSYPAFVLSAFRPVGILKGNKHNRGALLRKGLVVFQFVISICLIAGTLVVYNQLDYLQEVSLGFDKEQVLVASLDGGEDPGEFTRFQNALMQQANVINTAMSSEGLPSELLNGTDVQLEGTSAEDPENIIRVRTVSIGHDFFETLGVTMQAGRSFSLDVPSDSSAFILNATAARILAERYPDQLSSPETLVGRRLDIGSRTGPLVGIASDFNMASLHETIEPIAFYISPSQFDHFLIRVQAGNLSQTLAELSDVWGSFYPAWPFNVQFADQGFDAMYQAEERLGQIFSIFAVLAIIIACLGLFGLASFTAQQKTKEVGVRKVLGASTGSIILLFSKDFVRIVILAFLVAITACVSGDGSLVTGFCVQS